MFHLSIEGLSYNSSYNSFSAVAYQTFLDSLVPKMQTPLTLFIFDNHKNHKYHHPAGNFKKTKFIVQK
jgi:hypothetical protein